MPAHELASVSHSNTRLGGWLAVVSGILWLPWYWDDLVRWQRVAALALPCVLVNTVGWLYLRRSGKAGKLFTLNQIKYRWRRYRMRQKLRAIRYEDVQRNRRNERRRDDDEHRLH